MNRRMQDLSVWLKEQDCSFGFVTSTANVFYLSGFYCDPHERLLGIVVIPNEEGILVCPNMEVGQARSAGWTGDIIGYSDSDQPWELLSKAIHARIKDIHNIAIEKEHLTYGRSEILANCFPQASYFSIEDKLQEMRMIKDESELSILREAAKFADLGVEIGVHAIQKGQREMDVLATIEYELKKKGIRKMSFSTMVLAGEKSADPHGNPGLREIKQGDFVLFDLGVVIDGYCSDITRTVVVDQINDKQKEIYDTVLQAQQAALDLSKPNTRIGDLDLAARHIIEKAGYGDYFPHRIGHGLGIDVHEHPSMSHNNNGILHEGMTYTIEPGIYVPEIGGVRIEDDVLITPDGYECLTKYPKDLQIIKF